MSRAIESENHSLWLVADRINQQIVNMRDFARILAMAGASIDGDEGAAISTVGFEVVQMADRTIELTNGSASA